MICIYSASVSVGVGSDLKSAPVINVQLKSTLIYNGASLNMQNNDTIYIVSCSVHNLI